MSHPRRRVRSQHGHRYEPVELPLPNFRPEVMIHNEHLADQPEELFQARHVQEKLNAVERFIELTRLNRVLEMTNYELEDGKAGVLFSRYRQGQKQKITALVTCELNKRADYDENLSLTGLIYPTYALAIVAFFALVVTILSSQVSGGGKIGMICGVGAVFLFAWYSTRPGFIENTSSFDNPHTKLDCDCKALCFHLLCDFCIWLQCDCQFLRRNNCVISRRARARQRQ